MDPGTTRPPSQPRLPAAVLWDMDGTLVDTEPAWFAAERAAVAAHGTGAWSDEQATALVGRDLREAAQVLVAEAGVRLAVEDLVQAMITSVVAEVRRRVPWRPGARQLLAALREAGVPCALVTMSWTALTDEVVAALPEGTFAAVVTGDAVTRGKPHPEPYLTAAGRLGVDPRACVALEDSVPGATSALAAGATTVGVPLHVPLDALLGTDGFSLAGSLAELDVDRLGRLARARTVSGS